ncbi:glycosyltransferase family 4 protein [Photobacterium lutimaris]|uniref:Glycosyl transferase family 1 n=1 Tax=Photobacterium lutimaris TaxID=388278 RepID=A0A2T3J2R3_9GAMM|nr:glycosyltransferase family 4 protein [Photobacterium lutimaris]PSU35581.1 glycosyl transferase family 1 [Photobacterium lutimaris]TDR78633.1 glycosyltransferase involved in cell wall biosynthesis [Photobacterium lutimaris]
MKLLTITTLYPNAADPKHGIFVENRLRQLRHHHPDVECTVIAPVPWFPFRHRVFGQYAQFASVPRVEQRYGIKVYHPRYTVIPKIGMELTPHTLEACLRKQINALKQEGLEFDLIDGHYFFPDGVAIANIAKQLNKPFTVTARGTDINLIPQYPRPLHQIKQVLQHSSHNLAVCEALRQTMIKHGADPAKTTTARNGVDLALFHLTEQKNQHALREKLGLPSQGRIFMSVGLLIERKGHHLVIEAMAAHPDAHLLIAGSGPNLNNLKQLTRKLHLNERVTFLGALNQSELARYFGASDLSILASNREGWANVLLESMACGTPVVATNIWGTPEVVKTADAGLLVERDSKSIAKGIGELLAHLPDRQATRRYAEQFSWDETSHLLYQLFTQLVSPPHLSMPPQSQRLVTPHADKETQL